MNTTVFSDTQTKARPERIYAIVVAVAVLGFSGWVGATLPVQAAGILITASVLAYVGWLTTTYAHPVRSPTRTLPSL